MNRSEQSRVQREAPDLERWRGELAELITEARLPLAIQAQQRRGPQKLVAAALGGMRAATIRQRISGENSVLSVLAWLNWHGRPTWASCWTTCKNELLNPVLARCLSLCSLR